MLASGEFGSVRAATHKKTGAPCAIKVIKKGCLKRSSMRNQLNKNEFKILEAVDHPSIVRVFDLLEDDQSYFIVMELVESGTIRDLMRSEGGPFQEHEVADCI